MMKFYCQSCSTEFPNFKKFVMHRCANVIDNLQHRTMEEYV